MLLANYTFASFLWDMLLVFAFVIWFWLLITVFTDLFRRHDTSGFAKVLWVIFVIIAPYLGVLVYLLVEHQGMAERNMRQAQAQQAQFDQYVQSVASSGGAAAEIETAKGLLDSGAITQAEFDSIKQKALATS
jgi:Phospholipase_D-nuclease N-terminal/Short C-terminal domain